mmetsp:Transcript_65607/g.182462  ORF Transcript_65607/g.182462 Transcript_65607/m.182462 type:complete len:593 (-) Transcript_65607:76-1854(-)
MSDATGNSAYMQAAAAFGPRASRRGSQENNQEVLNRILSLFRAWDADGDGSISYGDLRRLMRFVTNGRIPDRTLEQLMQIADTNKSGCIELEEFVTWVFNPKTGMFGKDIEPSRIESSKCPAILDALREWFKVLDLNHNGFLDYEEFAIACLLLRSDMSVEEINEDFEALDANRNRKITLDEFLAVHTKLLDAIPRPVEEKVQLINKRKQKLCDMAHRTTNSGKTPQLDTEGFFDLVTNKYGSLEQGFQAMDEDGTGTLDIVQFRRVVEKLLGMDPGSQTVLLTVRTLFMDLDFHRLGTVSLTQLEEAYSRIRATTMRRRQARGGACERKSWSEEEMRNGLTKKGKVHEMVRFVVSLLKEKQSTERAPEAPSVAARSGRRVTPPGTCLPDIASSRDARKSNPSSRRRQASTSPPPAKSSTSHHLQQRATTNSGGIFAIGAERPERWRRCSHRRSLAKLVRFCQPRGIVDKNRVTPVEFELMVTAALHQTPGFTEHVKKHGSKVALRLHLNGWYLRDLFDAMDLDKSGAIDLNEWESVGNTDAHELYAATFGQEAQDSSARPSARSPEKSVAKAEPRPPRISSKRQSSAAGAK